MDNLTIVIPVSSREITDKELLPDGTVREAPRKPRTKVKEPSGGNLRVQWVKDGTGLKVEGSFPLFLRGNNVLCPVKVQQTVQEVVRRVLRLLDIHPTERESRLIREGKIKIDRIDVVGWVKTKHLSPSVGLVIESLNYGLKASRRACMYFPRETLVWNATSRYWSLMVYDKAAQLRAKQKSAVTREERTGDATDTDIWDRIPDEVKTFTTEYMRVELRMLRQELRKLKIEQVRDLDDEMLRGWVETRFSEMLEDLREPMPPIPMVGQKVTRTHAVALLRRLGVDVVAGMDDGPRRYMEKLLRDELNIYRHHQAVLDKEYTRRVSHLKSSTRRTVRFGAPPNLQDHIR